MIENEQGEIELPTEEGQNILCSGPTVDYLIDDIFGTELLSKNYENMKDSVILAPRNKEVHKINDKIIER